MGIMFPSPCVSGYFDSKRSALVSDFPLLLVRMFFLGLVIGIQPLARISVGSAVLSKPWV